MPSLLQEASREEREALREDDGGGQSALSAVNHSDLPKLLKGLFNVMLQGSLHPFNELHFLLQLLVHGVGDQLVSSPPLPQGQAFGGDLQRNCSRCQGLLSLLFELTPGSSHRNDTYLRLKNAFL